MTTYAWILVSYTVVLVLIVAAAFSVFRSQRTKLSRQLIFPFIGHIVMWSFFALMFFDGMIRVLFLATIVGIYAPAFYWILKTPHHDHAA